MPRKPENWKDQTIHVPIAVYARLEAEARRTKKTRSGFILAAIIFYCDHLYLQRKAARLAAAERKTARDLAAPTGDLENDADA